MSKQSAHKSTPKPKKSSLKGLENEALKPSASGPQTSLDKNSPTASTKTTLGKKRDRVASEERLIQAGKDIFSQHGFDGATTKMIAKQADINESLIGRYFDGKEGLLVAIVSKFIEELNKRELPYPAQVSLSLELDQYTRHRIQQSCIHEDFAKIIFSQALVNPTFKKRIRETVPLQLDVKLINRIQRLIDQGKLKAEAKAEEICEDIDSYLSGVLFHDVILHEKDHTFVQKRALRFMQNLASIFEKKK